MRVAIVGSRDYPRLTDVDRFVASLTPECSIVSGGARGVDRRAAVRGDEVGLDVFEHRADWTLGRHAGFLRNQTIVDDADVVVAFWDGRSRGTKDTITKARRAGKLLAVFQSEGDR